MSSLSSEASSSSSSIHNYGIIGDIAIGDAYCCLRPEAFGAHFNEATRLIHNEIVTTTILCRDLGVETPGIGIGHIFASIDENGRTPQEQSEEFCEFCGDGEVTGNEQCDNGMINLKAAEQSIRGGQGLTFSREIGCINGIDCQNGTVNIPAETANDTIPESRGTDLEEIIAAEWFSHLENQEACLNNNGSCLIPACRQELEAGGLNTRLDRREIASCYGFIRSGREPHGYVCNPYYDGAGPRVDPETGKQDSAHQCPLLYGANTIQ